MKVTMPAWLFVLLVAVAFAAAFWVDLMLLGGEGISH